MGLEELGVQFWLPVNGAKWLMLIYGFEKYPLMVLIWKTPCIVSYFMHCAYQWPHTVFTQIQDDPERKMTPAHQ